METNEIVIFETEYWRVVLVPQQRYLGRCVLVLKRSCGNLAIIEQEEQKDFFDVLNRLDQLFKRAFGSRAFNLSCQMNDAYRDTRPKPQVHLHFRPRYEVHVQVKIEGYVFEDPNFGDHPVDDKDDPPVSRRMLETINRELQKNL
ncbi:MAG: HIT family protein [Patescibacteria group bacterium]|nr:HIT family protein [Patescibacteria group bacterium]